MGLDFTRKPILAWGLVTFGPAGRDDAVVPAALLADREVLRLTGTIHSSDGHG